MNARVVTAVAGTIILLLGLAGLFYPERVLAFLGFAIAQPTHPAAPLGEVRATYGGIFVVMGVYTLASALDPGRHRGRLVLIALLWLGAFAGRTVGVFRDGNPGLPGWVALLFELMVGGGLLLAAQRAEAPLEEQAATPMAPLAPASGAGASPPVV
jgi:hypothetical protein